MEEGLINRYDGQCEPKTCVPYRRPTTRETLVEQKMHLEEKLKVVNGALDALNSNPEFERIHDLISKAL